MLTPDALLAIYQDLQRQRAAAGDDLSVWPEQRRAAFTAALQWFEDGRAPIPLRTESEPGSATDSATAAQREHPHST